MKKTARKPAPPVTTPLDAIATALADLHARINHLDQQQSTLLNALATGTQLAVPGLDPITLADLARQLNALQYRISRLELYTKRPL